MIAAPVIALAGLLSFTQSAPPVPASASRPVATRPAFFGTTRPALHVLSAPDKPTAVLLHLPGIGGLLRVDYSLVAGLRAGRPAESMRVESYNWPAYDLGMGALMNNERNRAEAKVVTAHILRLRREHPDLPLYITAHSGGTGILMWALADLPPDVQVDQIFLLASALSPRFDLSSGLSHVRGNCYVLTSTHDPVLPMCKMFGTIDRVRTSAAGLEGFVRPADAADPSQYAKLVAMPYRDEWMKLDNLGDHIGVMQRAFAARVLAPLLQPVRKTQTPAAP